MNNFLRIVLSAVALVGISQSASANAYRVVATRSTRANGMGEAVTASCNDPSAVAFNPAGIAGLEGTQVSVHGAIADLRAEHRSPLGQVTENESGWQFIPSLYLTTDLLHDSIVAGLGISVPSGFYTEWADDSFARYVDTLSELKVVDTSPCIGLSLTEDLRIGVGLNVLYSTVRLDRIVSQAAMFGVPGLPDTGVSFDGSGVGVGFNAGLVYDVGARHAVALAYRSATTVDFEGSMSLSGTDIDASASLEFPAIMTVGYMIKPVDALTVEFDVDWTNWDPIDSVVIELDTALVADQVIQMNFEDAFTYKVGMEYQCTDEIAVRCGYIRNPNATPEATWRPNLMDTTSHLFCGGIGYSRDDWALDASVVYVHFSEREIDNNVDSNEAIPSSSIDGTYTAYSPSFSLSATYTF